MIKIFAIIAVAILLIFIVLAIYTQYQNRKIK